jgi:hypothetical protein
MAWDVGAQPGPAELSRFSRAGHGQQTCEQEAYGPRTSSTTCRIAEVTSLGW